MDTATAPAPSVMLPSATKWIRAAADRLEHQMGVDRRTAMLRALDVLDWVEDTCGQFGAEGFDWSPDAAAVAVDEFLED